MGLQLSPEKIKEIAEELDTGMVCFYNTKTGELQSYPDEMSHPDFDSELWQEIIDGIEENSSDYIRFEPMESHESFALMEDFIRLIPDKDVQQRFENAILHRKPFQQFKNLLLDYPELRGQWFPYKEERYMDYVRQQALGY